MAHPRKGLCLGCGNLFVVVWRHRSCAISGVTCLFDDTSLFVEGGRRWLFAREMERHRGRWTENWTKREEQRREKAERKGKGGNARTQEGQRTLPTPHASPTPKRGPGIDQVLVVGFRKIRCTMVRDTRELKNDIAFPRPWSDYKTSQWGRVSVRSFM